MSEHTPGPWQVIEKKIPHYHNEGHHTLRMIYTSWVDGQLKDFAPVVGQSWGLPEKEGDPAVPLIWLEEADARLIARAPEMAAEIERLTARVEELERALKSHDAIDRRRLAARLAARYNANPSRIAELCDGAIDPSGRLLGYVREEARAAITQESGNE